MESLVSHDVCLRHVFRLSPRHQLFVFFFHATPTPQLYTLSLHDALPISPTGNEHWTLAPEEADGSGADLAEAEPSASSGDRKSTRLNSSHVAISYAVFCLKKKKKKDIL